QAPTNLIVVQPAEGPTSLRAEQRCQAPGHGRKVPDPRSWGGEVPIDQGTRSSPVDDEVPYSCVVVTHDNGTTLLPRERRSSPKSAMPGSITRRVEGG